MIFPNHTNPQTLPTMPLHLRKPIVLVLTLPKQEMESIIAAIHAVVQIQANIKETGFSQSLLCYIRLVKSLILNKF
jgi:hypothetical protein